MELREVEVRNGVDTFPEPDEGAIDFTGEVSLTRQSEYESTDINLIMKRYERTGMLPDSILQGMFADVSEMGDFRSALAIVEAGEEAFMALEPKVRSRFDNDAATFLEFFNDSANIDELRAMGLIEPAAAAPVGPVEPLAPQG